MAIGAFEGFIPVMNLAVVPSYDNSDSTNPDSQQSVVVEGSYKRPKFLTSLERPKTDVGKWARDLTTHFSSSRDVHGRIWASALRCHYLLFDLGRLGFHWLTFLFRIVAKSSMLTINNLLRGRLSL